MNGEEHDAIVKLTTMMEMVRDDVKEIKTDIKELNGKYHELDTRVTRNALKTGGILTGLVIVFSLLSGQVKRMVGLG